MTLVTSQSEGKLCFRIFLIAIKKAKFSLRRFERIKNGSDSVPASGSLIIDPSRYPGLCPLSSRNAATLAF